MNRKLMQIVQVAPPLRSETKKSAGNRMAMKEEAEGSESPGRSVADLPSLGVSPPAAQRASSFGERG
jgi:hypothetical protein